MFVTFYPSGGGGGATAVSADVYTPDLTFAGAWETSGGLVANSWFYTVVTSGGFDYVTVTGTVALQPDGAGTEDTMTISLPVAPQAPWSYPQQLAGTGVPNSGTLIIGGGGDEPTSVVLATVGALTASVDVAAIAGTARTMTFTFTYRV